MACRVECDFPQVLEFNIGGRPGGTTKSHALIKTMRIRNYFPRVVKADQSSIDGYSPSTFGRSYSTLSQDKGKDGAPNVHFYFPVKLSDQKNKYFCHLVSDRPIRRMMWRLV